MEQNFKVGDIVRLKSGGPEMTVKTLSPLNARTYNDVGCSWFFEGTVQEVVLPPEALESASMKADQTIQNDPLLSEAMKLKLMEAAMKFAYDQQDFLHRYIWLYDQVVAIKMGSLDSIHPCQNRESDKTSSASVSPYSDGYPQTPSDQSDQAQNSG